MFENMLTHNGIRFSRYIASWKRMGGKIYGNGLFEKWLKEKEQLTDEEIRQICILATNGKLELQNSAMDFMEEHSEEHLEERKIAALGGVFEDCQGQNISFVRKLYEKMTEEFNKGDDTGG